MTDSSPLEGAPWFISEWMDFIGKRQADLQKELGWGKGRASKVYNKRVGYYPELIAELAEWLGIEPFELFMLPEEATALRRLRETAMQIAADSGAASWAGPGPDARIARRTGTRG